MTSDIYRSLPVALLREIASRYGKAQIIVLSLDGRHRMVNVATYGVSAADKLAAARLGDVLAKASGADVTSGSTSEDFRADMASAQAAAAYDAMHDALAAVVAAARRAPSEEQFGENVSELLAMVHGAIAGAVAARSALRPSPAFLSLDAVRKPGRE